MKRADRSLIPSLNQSWTNFSKAWKTTRAKASEKSVHDLRVSTRRLIAILELAKTLSGNAEIARLQRRFKKVLKGMGDLRDTQVLLLNISRIPKSSLIGDFKRTLLRRENREIGRIRDALKNRRKRNLSKAVDDVCSHFETRPKARDYEKFHRSIERVLTTRGNALSKAQRRFQRTEPPNDDLLHEMRIALKKFRYVVEAAEPVLGASAKLRAREMHSFQQLIGDSRDVEMLRTALEKWASKRGKKIAVVPALDRLQEQQDTLVKQIMDSLNDLEQTLSGTLKPVVEKTHAVAPNGQTSNKIDVKPAPAD